MDGNRTCANCIHSFAANNGNLHCRESPPQVIGIIGPVEVSVVDQVKFAAAVKKYEKEKAAWDKATSKRLLPPQEPEPRMYQTMERSIGLQGYASNFPKVEPSWQCGKISLIMMPQAGSNIPLIGVK